MNENIDIIVSRYNEDLKWLLEPPFNKYKYIVYNKGINDDFEKTNIKKIVKLNNVGREGHTYLYHIIHNYDNLNNINVFLPGSVNNNNKKNKAIKLLNKIEKHKKAVFLSHNDIMNSIKNRFNNFILNNHNSTSFENKSINNESQLFKSRFRPYGYWYIKMFGNIKTKHYIYNGIFSISKKDILQHNVNRYKKIINGLNKHSNPEEGHYVERSWGAIFHPLNNTIIEKI